ncbi:MAG: prolyl oligopeptidase family serine peptidase [Verrucomicrobiaceae bacterium]|nr:prolyl oligopeptidase family serine peptidase [Verrucomicrobiaceae bacterium]
MRACDHILPAAALLALVSPVILSAAEPIAPITPIPRRLPPPGTVVLPETVRASLEERVAAYGERVWEIDHKAHAADIAVLVKAVDFALRHNEFYSEKEIPLAAEILDLADRRYAALAEEDERPWLDEKGLVIRGYRSSIDDSYQPYGLEIPESLDLSRPVPLLVWLHGRGDKTTDLHFLQRCRTKSQAFGGLVGDQQEAVVLHPFGRHCVGWKHAGEIDVFEAIEAVKADYPIDPERIILAGFSMGGAGAWHIGAHYRDQFCAVHAGAGFAETKEYTKLVPENFPPAYEQTLWKAYDVPNYVRNFQNGPLLAYSGAEDGQKAAADLMARELAKVGHTLRHVIGEGMGHRYNKESVQEIRHWLTESWAAGRQDPARRIEWQTPTLRYPSYDWLHLTGLEAHWEGARALAERDPEKKQITLQLEGVTALEISAGREGNLAGFTVRIGGIGGIGEESVLVEDPGFPVNTVSLVRPGEEGAKWTFGEPRALAKRPGVQGPIDDAFLSRFLVVPPDSLPAEAGASRWLDFELNHFRERWRALMRGELPEKSADEVDSDDISTSNLILWGDPDSNPLIAEIADRLPVRWRDGSFTLRGETYASDAHVPVLIFPNPLNPDRYVVLNSGLTFREGHDRTNSLQNPKLPDWAVIGLDRDPDALAPGRIVEAGFFDESWE